MYYSWQKKEKSDMLYQLTFWNLQQADTFNGNGSDVSWGVVKLELF